MNKEPIIETGRLLPRPITLGDAQACYSWNSDERVTRFMSYSTYTDIAQTVEWIKSAMANEEEWLWVFVLKGENRIIGSGSIGPSALMQGFWGIGYNLHYDYWHRGYCTEAMKAIVDFAHRELGINKICSEHAVDNPRSGKVMEKCGMKFERFGEYSKLDGSETFKAMIYTRVWE